ncbi:MAG: hypothetical protein ACFFBP_04470 [Promethearchaeota archaeon]
MERIIVVHWNKNTGPEPIIQYPPKEDFPSTDLFVKLWTIHELNKERSMLEYVPEGDNWYISVPQKYAGELYFLVLAYGKNHDLENIIDFDILSTMAGNLIKSINTDKITRSIFETFNLIKDYTKLDQEENLMTYFQDKLKITILQILRNGVISKSELAKILTEDYGFSTLNIDLLLTTFIRDNLIIKKSVPGSRECYFLIKDISFLQIPPKKKPAFSDNQEEEYLNSYRDQITKFYSNFEGVSEMENKKVINLMVNNHDIFMLLKSLRKKVLTVAECLTILNNDEDLFYEVLESEFIHESKGLVYLILDLRFVSFTPFYIIKKLIKRYNNEEISLDEYLIHLELLSKQYIEKSGSIGYEII